LTDRLIVIMLLLWNVIHSILLALLT